MAKSTKGSSGKSKSSGKTSIKSASTSYAPGAVSEKVSSEVRQIENGFVIRESGYKGKGRNQEYISKEYFSKVNPMKEGVVKQLTSTGMKFGGKK